MAITITLGQIRDIDLVIIGKLDNIDSYKARRWSKYFMALLEKHPYIKKGKKIVDGLPNYYLRKWNRFSIFREFCWCNDKTRIIKLWSIFGCFSAGCIFRYGDACLTSQFLSPQLTDRLSVSKIFIACCRNQNSEVLSNFIKVYDDRKKQLSISAGFIKACKFGCEENAKLLWQILCIHSPPMPIDVWKKAFVQSALYEHHNVIILLMAAYKNYRDGYRCDANHLVHSELENIQQFYNDLARMIEKMPLTMHNRKHIHNIIHSAKELHTMGLEL